MEAILYIGHGTRSKQGVEEAKTFLQRVMNRTTVPIQEISFLELTEPLIDEGFQRCVDRGVTEITVVPLFLLAAGHIKEDIPKAISVLCKKYPHVRVQIRDPFGVQDRILDGIADIVRNTVPDLTSRDSLLIVGRGSSDPGIHKAFARIEAGMRRRLRAKYVSVCYLASSEPKFDEGLEMLSKKTHDRMIVIPYLLFNGLLLNEISLKVKKRQKLGQQIIHTGPLSRQRVIEDIVIEKALFLPEVNFN